MSSSYTPRPFPPPPLVGVPTQYIIHQLRSLAPSYWNRPETSDCTIGTRYSVTVHLIRANAFHLSLVIPLIPTPPSSREDDAGNITDALGNMTLDSNSQTPLRSSPPSEQEGVDSTESAVPPWRRTRDHVVMHVRLNVVNSVFVRYSVFSQVHVDYLCLNSVLLRQLLTVQLPEMQNRGEPLPPAAHFGPELSSSLSIQPAAPPLPPPRLLPGSQSDHPVVYLPVPDPSSLHYLIHYMYFGSTYHIDQALDRGVVSWDGVARNVEHLGISTDVELFLTLY